MKVVESKLNALTAKDDERKDQEKEVEATTTTTTMPPIKIHILDVVNQNGIYQNVGIMHHNRSGHMLNYGVSIKRWL